MPEEKSDLELLAEKPAEMARKRLRQNPHPDYDAARFLVELHQAAKEHEMSKRIDLLTESVKTLHDSLEALRGDVKSILDR